MTAILAVLIFCSAAFANFWVSGDFTECLELNNPNGIVDDPSDSLRITIVIVGFDEAYADEVQSGINLPPSSGYLHGTPDTFSCSAGDVTAFPATVGPLQFGVPAPGQFQFEAVITIHPDSLVAGEGAPLDMHVLVRGVDLSQPSLPVIACADLFHTIALPCAIQPPNVLSGNLSGILGPGMYSVVDTIAVQAGDSLAILPGTTLNFAGPYPFNVAGTLLAEGTETDSIVFTTDTLANPAKWRGIRFLSPEGQSHLRFCHLSRGFATDELGDSDIRSGGALFAVNTSLLIENSLFDQNEALSRGGAIYCRNSNLILHDCVFTANLAHFAGGFSGGGGLYVDGGAAELHTCHFSNNAAGKGCAIYTLSAIDMSATLCEFVDNSANDSWLGIAVCVNMGPGLIDSCLFARNPGGVQVSLGFGVVVSNSQFYDNTGIYGAIRGLPAEVKNCKFRNNSSTESYGGAIGAAAGALPLIPFRVDNCIFEDNSALLGGGAIGIVYAGEQELPVHRCLFIGNTSSTGRDIYLVNSAPQFGTLGVARLTNCSLFGSVAQGGSSIYCYIADLVMSDCICSNVTGSAALILDSSQTNQVISSCFYGNMNGNISEGAPAGFEMLEHTNANGDSCDIYGNIFLDPMFVDTANGDFHLMAASPCIDAGNPGQLDPDNTISDIGAFYFPHELPDYDPSQGIYLTQHDDPNGRRLAWRPFANAIGYKVYRTSNASLPHELWTELATLPSSQWSFLDTDDFDELAQFFYYVTVLY